MFAALQTVLQTALAAIAAVPSVLVRWVTSSLPMWNMPFSMPDGMPMARMRRMKPISGCSAAALRMRSGLPAR